MENLPLTHEENRLVTPTRCRDKLRILSNVYFDETRKKKNIWSTCCRGIHRSVISAWRRHQSRVNLISDPRRWWDFEWVFFFSSFYAGWKVNSIFTIPMMVWTLNPMIVFEFDHLSSIVGVREKRSIWLETRKQRNVYRMAEISIVSVNFDRRTFPSVLSCISGDPLSNEWKTIRDIEVILLKQMDRSVNVFILDHLERIANINYRLARRVKRHSTGNSWWERRISRKYRSMAMWWVMRHYSVIRVCCVSIGERSVMEFNIVSRVETKRTVIYWRWINVMLMNIDAWMERVFPINSFSKEVSIDRMKCRSRKVTAVLERVPVENGMIVFVHRMNGRVVMENVFLIGWTFIGRHQTLWLVRVDEINISSVKLIQERRSGQCPMDDAMLLQEKDIKKVRVRWILAETSNANLFFDVLCHRVQREVVRVAVIQDAPIDWKKFVLHHWFDIHVDQLSVHFYTFSSIAVNLGETNRPILFWLTEQFDVQIRWSL